jgi:CRISPR-associated endonuclease/helicase Cas3
MSFFDFFKVATGNEPYAYQCRLACGDAADPDNPETLKCGVDCSSRLISIPTGLGKTAAVTLAWLWNRVVRKDEAWPRRLVYCLPMRTLVEQTTAEVEKWLRNLSSLKEYSATNNELLWLRDHSPIILMGGEDNNAERRDWDIHPEQPAILVGTQDMLLSRALNRGYGMSRARWPMHFALLNNDALWLIDETQLMGPGLWTSAQLDWLRNDRFKPFRKCSTWWLSATIGEAFLETRDRIDAVSTGTLKSLAPTVEIIPEEAEKLTILQAQRPVELWSSHKNTRKKKSNNNESLDDIFLYDLSQSIVGEHRSGSLSLVVCNTVASAQKTFLILKSYALDITVMLLTSRFRKQDRIKHLRALLEFEDARKKAAREGRQCDHAGLICVSTQVVEAGVDISARRLWTELAPWPSMLQRLGRLNRDAKLNDEARAFVFEVPQGKTDKKEGTSGPYADQVIIDSKKIITALAAQCADSLGKPIRSVLDQLHADSAVAKLIDKSLQPKAEPFPRAFDIHGLFSTEPDVFGGFTDVSPWIRGSDQNADVTVFWREWDESRQSLNAVKIDSDLSGPVFRREEGCAVAVYRLRSFVENCKSAFIWNDKAEEWVSIKGRDICPGMVVLLPASAGGYSESTGWTGVKTDRPSETSPPGPFDNEGDRDKLTAVKSQWIALDEHLSAVASEAQRICTRLELPPAQQKAVAKSGGAHDIGKSYEQWQRALPDDKPDESTLWAKAPSFVKRARMRHEAASALAAWDKKFRSRTADFPALTIYLIAAHHGLVRTVLTSRADARQPNIAGILITDPSPTLPWRDAKGERWSLDFACAQDGSEGAFSEDDTGNLVFTPLTPSWTALVADLLGGWEADAPQCAAGCISAEDEHEPHSLNPFHLALLETLLRAADCRVSASETGIPEQATPQPSSGITI